MHLSQVADLARSLDATSFVARMPEPVLIGVAVIGAIERGTNFDTPEKGTPLSGFRTHRAATERFEHGSASETSIDFAASPLDSAVAEATPPTGSSVKDPEVISLSKTLRNPFQQMITVGRSPNNDVVLDDKSVSKVHGYFRKTDFRWWLHDQPSTNGTFLDEDRVGATGRPLTDGAKIGFGPRLTFRFYTARGLHKLLTARR